MAGESQRGRPIRQPGTFPGGHVPVMPREVMRWLRPTSGETVADCTLGYGGHAAEFLKRIGPAGRLVAMDVDGPEVQRAGRRLAAMGVPLSLHQVNFARLPEVMAEEKLDGFDIIFADLGVSSMQIDDPRRGIGYAHDGPLDMRMDDRGGPTGADLLASMSQEELSAALEELSDEGDHRRIAEWIVRQRQVRPISTTGELVRLVLNAKGYSPRSRRRPWEVPGGPHPAAKTFQALRILVNGELESLKSLLAAVPRCLRGGGRVGIISFHSGEDRLVKNAFRDGLREGVYRNACPHVIVPSSREVHENPRSSSAKFRWACLA